MRYELSDIADNYRSPQRSCRGRQPSRRCFTSQYGLTSLIDQALAALEKPGSKPTARLSLSHDPVRSLQQ